MKLANSPNKSWVQNVVFSWNDTVSMREENASLVTLINDTEKAPQQALLNALNEYSIVPVAWSEKDKLLKIVA